MAGRPKPLFFLAVGAVVIALLSYAYYAIYIRDNPQAGQVKQTGDDKKPGDKQPGGGDRPVGASGGLLLELREQIVASGEIPTIGPAGDYKPKGDVIDVEISEWGGYAPLIVANGGLEPNPDSYFARQHGFKLKIVISEAEVEGWQRINSGQVGASVTTVDVLAIYGNQLKVETPIQFDFSRGGDGILVTKDITSINQLKGRILAVAQFTEVDFFIRFLAQEAQLKVKALSGPDDPPDPERINLLFTKTAEEAAGVFAASVKGGSDYLSGCVTWNPFTLEIPEQLPDKVRLLTSNRNLLVVADILIVNAGFAKQNPKIVKGLVDGILAGGEDIRRSPETTLPVVAAAFSTAEEKTTVADVQEMLADVHLSNHAENMLFFAPDPGKIGNFRELYFSAVYAYGRETIKNPTPPEKLINRSYLEELAGDARFKDQTVTLAPVKQEGSESLERNPLLTKQVRFAFEANSGTLDLADENNKQAVKDLTVLLKLAPGSNLLLRGHVDNLKVPEFQAKGEAFFRKQSVRAVELSKQRAEAVRTMLVKDSGIDEKRLDSEGRGWDEPLPGAQPEENRRVEVQLFTLE